MAVRRGQTEGAREDRTADHRCVVLRAAFVAYDAITALVAHEALEHSGLGIGIAALSLLVMPTVSFVQRRAAQELGSHSAVADSKQTLPCTYLSAGLLVGLLANSAPGWWWADPVAALVIAGLAVREGVNAWNGDACCSSEALFEHDDHDHDGAHAHVQATTCGPGCSC